MTYPILPLLRVSSQTASRTMSPVPLRKIEQHSGEIIQGSRKVCFFSCPGWPGQFALLLSVQSLFIWRLPARRIFLPSVTSLFFWPLLLQALAPPEIKITFFGAGHHVKFAGVLRAPGPKTGFRRKYYRVALGILPGLSFRRVALGPNLFF